MLSPSWTSAFCAALTFDGAKKASRVDCVSDIVAAGCSSESRASAAARSREAEAPWSLRDDAADITLLTRTALQLLCIPYEIAGCGKFSATRQHFLKNSKLI